MEIAVLFSFGLIAALVILPVLTFVKVNNIAYEIEELKRLVSNKHVQKDKAARPEAAPCHVDAPVAPVVPAVPKRQADLPRPIVLCEESESRVEVKATALMADELPTAMDIFWTKIEDWFCVRGSFAPEGMTREFAVATRWLVRMGIILVTGSVVYFAKLSIDRGWMGPTGRVVAMVSCGAAACVAGVWLTRRTRYGIIGHALAALGSTALYLGFGLGHRFFDPPVISSAGIAFAALVGVTIASGVMSVALKSSVIAVMSLVGGYLVPLIAPCGGESPLPLCAYMLLLNAGAFLVARMRGWSMLDFLAAAAAYLISFNWCIHNASASSTAHTEMLAALAAVHALYMASVVAGANARGKAGNIIAWAGLAANACTLFGWISTCFRGHFSNEAAGGVVLALSAAYLATAYFVRRQGRADAQTINILAFFGVAFLAISPLMILGVRWCCVSWSVLAAVMASAERRTDMKMFGWMAQITLLAAAMVGLFNIAPMEYYAEADAASASYWRNLALRAVRLWTLPASAVWISRRTRSFGWLLSAAGAVAFLFYSCEAWRFAAVFLPSFKHGAVTLAWTLAAFTGVWYGLSARLKAYRLAGLVLLGVSAAKLLFIDTRQLATPARVAAFAVVGVLFIVGAFLYIRFKERFEDKKD